ncbi:MAG: DotI/IcmL family type IV secretion protein [Alphaproteobacteria bacterium]|jgi:hypothetical protein
MFKFWYEKFVMRFAFVLAFLAFIGVLFYAVSTELNQEPPATIAPFKENVKEVETQTISLAAAHRSNREIESWLQEAVSEALSFDLSTYKSNAKNIYPYFTKAGFQEYQKYLQDTGIFETLKTRDNRISVFVEGQSLLLNTSSVEGVYRWLYQVPITISFLPRNANDLTKTKDVVTKQLDLRLQVTRVNLKNDPDAVQIESWVAARRK